MERSTLERFLHRRGCRHHRHRVMGCRAAHPTAPPGHRRCTCQYTDLFLGHGITRLPRERGQTVLAEFRNILGLNPFAKPLFSRIFRWHLGMPQYTLGHLERVALIEDRSAQIPGLALAGGSYRGVGVPNCIESRERAVSQILSEWGIDLAEDQAEEKR